MFCSKCGAILPESSKFCPECGTPIAESTSSAVLPPIIGSLRDKLPTKLDVNTIAVLVVSVIMLLTMMMLPVFSLGDAYTDDYGGSYIINLLGNEYMTHYEILDGISTFSHIAFVLMLISLIAIIAFRCAKRSSIAATVFNCCILLIYNLYVFITWGSESSHRVTLGSGNIICILCAIVLCILAYYKKPHTDPSLSDISNSSKNSY